uniref:Vacuolar-sorting protein SNF8 n=1 Tax=Panagrolaimus sp. JU765 TaxID=591449 RepID=A0AC34QRJ5_9BILA
MATRRRVGVGAVKQKQDLQAKFQIKGEEIASEQLAQFSSQLEMFKTKLEDFAMKHKDEIRKNSQFRRHFQEMCATVGVDPLASSKGFWAEKLGFGEFYYQLSVKIIEVCLSTANMNGGIMTIDDLRNRLIKSQPRNQKEAISHDDVIRAVKKLKSDDVIRTVKKLKSLGYGFELIAMGGGRFLIMCVPGELSMDDTRVLQLAEENSCHVTRELIMDRLCWDEHRVELVLDRLVKDGRAWIDAQANDTLYYYFPSLFLEQYNNGSNGSVSGSNSSAT